MPTRRQRSQDADETSASEWGVNEVSFRFFRWLGAPTSSSASEWGVNEMSFRLSVGFPFAMPTRRQRSQDADETSALPGTGGFVIHFVGFVKTIWHHLP